MQMIFSNNATVTLSAALAPGDTTVEILDSFNNFRQTNSGYSNSQYQVLTLWRDSEPARIEIVHLLFNELYSTSWKIVRAREGTTAKAWAVGDKLSARITAGMLANLAQTSGAVGGNIMLGAEGNYPAIMAGGSGVALGAKIREVGPAWAVAGHSILQLHEGGGGTPTFLGSDGAYESYVSTPSVGLGLLDGWEEDRSYANGDVVEPPSPNGRQYHLHLPQMTSHRSPLTPINFNVHPIYASGAAPTPGIKGAIPEAPRWYEMDFRVGQMFFFRVKNARFFPTEVGFIARNVYDFSTLPVVSIGSVLDTTIDDPTRYANSVALNKIAANNSIHRIPVDSSVGVKGFSVRLDTPSAEAFPGRFYIKGLFAQTGDY